MRILALVRLKFVFCFCAWLSDSSARWWLGSCGLGAPSAPPCHLGGGRSVPAQPPEYATRFGYFVTFDVTVTSEFVRCCNRVHAIIGGAAYDVGRARCVNTRPAGVNQDCYICFLHLCMYECNVATARSAKRSKLLDHAFKSVGSGDCSLTSAQAWVAAGLDNGLRVSLGSHGGLGNPEGVSLGCDPLR